MKRPFVIAALLGATSCAQQGGKRTLSATASWPEAVRMLLHTMVQ